VHDPVFQVTLRSSDGIPLTAIHCLYLYLYLYLYLIRHFQEIWHGTLTDVGLVYRKFIWHHEFRTSLTSDTIIQDGGWYFNLLATQAKLKWVLPAWWVPSA